MVLTNSKASPRVAAQVTRLHRHVKGQALQKKDINLAFKHFTVPLHLLPPAGYSCWAHTLEPDVTKVTSLNFCSFQILQKPPLQTLPERRCCSFQPTPQRSLHICSEEGNVNTQCISSFLLQYIPWHGFGRVSGKSRSLCGRHGGRTSP